MIAQGQSRRNCIAVLPTTSAPCGFFQSTSKSAVAASSVGVNILRALGPALGGAAIAGLGIVAPFWINTISNLGSDRRIVMVAAAELIQYGSAGRAGRRAIEAGLRYARHSPALRATLIRNPEAEFGLRYRSRISLRCIRATGYKPGRFRAARMRNFVHLSRQRIRFPLPSPAAANTR